MNDAEEKNDMQPEDDIGSTGSIDDTTMGPGSQIGPYKLLRVLGEGGCGLVYLAERSGSMFLN